MRDLHDLIIIYDFAIEALEEKASLAMAAANRARKRLRKATHQVEWFRDTEKLRQKCNMLDLEVGVWKRRICVAKQRKKELEAEKNYYKIGGSC